MPHQCVRCNTFYDDGAKEILHGCSCGARLFFYVRKEKLEKAKDLGDVDRIWKTANISACHCSVILSP